MLSGCMVIGYQTGAIIDNYSATLDGMTADECSTECHRGDKVSIYCNDGVWYCGVIQRIRPREFIELKKDRGSIHAKDLPQFHKIYWAQIESVTKLNRSAKARKMLMITGAMCDLLHLLVM
ncbi:hypothetical protein ACFLQV_01125 [Calditrichota bacterium]